MTYDQMCDAGQEQDREEMHERAESQIQSEKEVAALVDSDAEAVRRQSEWMESQRPFVYNFNEKQTRNRLLAEASRRFPLPSFTARIAREAAERKAAKDAADFTAFYCGDSAAPFWPIGRAR